MKLGKTSLYLISLFIVSLLLSVSYAVTLNSERYHHVDFITAEVSPSDNLQLIWKNPITDVPYQSFNNLSKILQKNQTEIIFAINSGIFGQDQAPLGWHVEKGQRLQALNQITRKDAVGNFSLIPNGVFFIEKNGERHVMETNLFLENQHQYDIEYATQSGPMLVINGRIHPKFYQSSESVKYRSGVCVKDQTSYFVVTQSPINFYYFAAFFYEKLGCDNALYLDGTLSQMFYQGKIYGAPFWNVRPYVGMWIVTKPSSMVKPG